MDLCNFFLIVHIFVSGAASLPLRFNQDGQFKILQIADMHYANGGSTRCSDVLPKEYGSCSDLNTTAFIENLIALEKPDLIVFSGDNIFGQDTSDPVGSMNAAFAPAIKAHIPWAAILGNHDQESTLSRLELMQHISSMENTLSRVYPTNINSSLGGDMTEIDGFGNYHLAVRGAADSRYQNENILNIYLLDSGDYSKDHKIHGYGWIQESQKSWFKELSLKLKDDFSKAHPAQHVSVPSLVYFHIPLLETSYISSWCSIMGAKQEAIGCAQVNSGFLNAMVEVGDPHLVFNGHDHINDFCSELAENIMMCYGGGAGYHAYGKAGWSRRARVVDISLHSIWDEVQKNASASRTHKSEGAVQRREWLEVDQITTWKRLDRPPSFPLIDHEVLWSRIPVPSNGRNYCWNATLVTIVGAYSLICIIYCFWRKHPRLLRIQPLQRHHLHVYNVYKPFGYRMFKFQASP